MYENRVDERPQRSGLSPRLILFLVIGVAAVIFILQNGDTLRLNFLMFEFSAPEWLIFVILLVAGALLDRLVQFQQRRRRARVVET